MIVAGATPPPPPPHPPAWWEEIKEGGLEGGGRGTEGVGQEQGGRGYERAVVLYSGQLHEKIDFNQEIPISV